MTSYALWSDDPSVVDLLSFDAVAATAADVLLDPLLDPVALGLSGTWGSGKTTVLGLVRDELASRETDGTKVLVIETDPWRYDPSVGIKESLIAEVLAALAAEIEADVSVSEEVKRTARGLAAKLARRVDWAQAIKLTAKTSLTLQLPSVDDLVGLIKAPDGGGPDAQAAQTSRGLEMFRAEFAELVTTDALKHVSRVAVLVDDLDRCLPETVVETLEAIRLFLAVPRMSFVIAADEARVADAIRTRFRDVPTPQAADEDEEPAKLYLHKIVQTTIPLPALSHFDTQAYLLLLQLQQNLAADTTAAFIDQCANIRRSGGTLDDLSAVDGVDITEQLAFASRLTPILYEKLQGNPRRIKRFLNDLRVRLAIAGRRGIDLDVAVVAKLMVLERLLPLEFEKMLSWLAAGRLRDQLEALEAVAGAPPKPEPEPTPEKPAKQPSGRKTTPRESPEPPAEPAFPQPLIRWAKLTPALAGMNVAPYLVLAASFSGAPLIDSGLPERLRDVAAHLLERVDRRLVKDEDLERLSVEDAEALIRHLGRTVRDQPSRQKFAVSAVLRIARLRPELGGVAMESLTMLPVGEISRGTPILFKHDDATLLLDVLGKWREASQDSQLKTAIDTVLGSPGDSK